MYLTGSTTATSSYISLDGTHGLVRCHPVLEDMARFRDPQVEVRHEDFDVRSKEYRVFRLQDYNWGDNGVELVGQYMPGVGELLDELFTETLSITDSRCGYG